MAQKKIMTYIVCVLLGVFSFNISAKNTMNTFGIAIDTLEALPNCLHYKIKGVCFWLKCTLGVICYVSTTLKVDHYLPDLVDTVYPKNNKDPWFIVNNTIDVADYAAGSAVFSATTSSATMMGGSFDAHTSHDGNIKLRQVDVIGNPTLRILHWPFFLNSQAAPMLPYYQSELDASSWRSGITEQLYIQSWTPGLGDIGTPIIDDWGSTYPRSGFLMQANIGKASAVMAVRGASISTTESLNHIAKNLNGVVNPNKGGSTAPSVYGGKTDKIEWQMLLPDEKTTCSDKINTSSNPIWTKHQKEDQSYAWVIWREYYGCINTSGTYIWSIG